MAIKKWIDRLWGPALARWVLAAVITAVMLALANCQSPRPLAVTGHYYTKPVEHYPNINIVAVDWGLTGIWHGDVQVADQWTEWTPDGRLRIVVEFENRTRESLPLQVQTAFKDGQDRFLRDETAWENIVLPRNSTYRYEATAFDSQAEKAHVRVRRQGH